MSFLLIDIAGLELNAEDMEILAHPSIAGVILFTRNYHDPQQLKALTRSINSINEKLFIVVDQEGGRVQRFRSHFSDLPSMREWSNRYKKEPAKTIRDLSKTIEIMAQELQAVGVYSSLVPVLDIDFGVSEIISDRSFGDIELINSLAEILIATLHKNKMPCTGKHFPGHGAVALDSHDALPIDYRPFSEILAKDLVPYKKFINQLDSIMPAHIIYPEVDSKPAGFSEIWLKQILRGQLGFNGLIMSDDISMKATTQFGSYTERAELALNAGCDVIPVCNYREGVISIIDSIGNYFDPESERRIEKYNIFNGVFV